MSIVIVTGTSTGVGKSVTTAALAVLRAAEGTVAVCKPAQTGVTAGEGGDLDEVRRLAGDLTSVELARYPDPLAPDTAARRARMPMLCREDVAARIGAIASIHDHVVIEGAGGVLVRLGEDGFTIADVAADVGAAAVVVVDPGLGALNHAALTVRALAAAGVQCEGLVIGWWPKEPDLAMRCNLVDLPAVTGVPILGRIPAGAGRLRREEFAAGARRWLRC